MTMLSVIIPAYNVRGFIPKTLLSILKQNSGKIEVIVVNDGSTDGTGQAVREFIDKNCPANFRLLEKDNGGVSEARNMGLEQAEGQYVFFLDGDDCLGEGIIPQLLEVIDGEAPDIIHWPFELVDEAGALLAPFVWRETTPLKSVGIETLKAWLLRKTTKLWSGSIAYKKSLIDQSSLRFTSGTVAGEDTEFICKALSRASCVHFIKQAVTYYLQRFSSVMNTYNIRKFDAVLALERVRDWFICLDTPDFQLLAAHVDDYMILHSYAGTYSMCLKDIVHAGKAGTAQSARRLSMEIDVKYPGLQQRMLLKMASRRRKLLPDRIDIFRVSPAIYMHLSNLTGKPLKPARRAAGARDTKS